MRFTKMEGLGNDYIYLNGLDGLPEDLPGLARRMSDRHFGVGSDGLICICPSDRADFKMQMFNADGSQGEMCGNGIRCLGKYVYDKGLTRKRTLSIETGGGLRTLELLTEDGLVKAVRVNMGRPQVGAAMELTAGDRLWQVIPVSMGNPHAVLFVDQPEELDLATLGPSFEHHPAFPGGVNTEFVRCVSQDRLVMRVWERGSGETLACGTGACAALAAAVVRGKCGRQAAVELPGGVLELSWPAGQEMIMTGPATTVFEGEYLI